MWIKERGQVIAYKGENVIQMTNDGTANGFFYAHPKDEFGQRTRAWIEAYLDTKRQPNPAIAASLDDTARRFDTVKLMEYLMK